MPTNLTEPGTPTSTWRPAQAYIMAVVCLLIGLPIGYLIRGSAQPEAKTVAASAATGSMPAAPASASGNVSAPAQMPSLDDMKRMAGKQAEPLLAQLQNKPNDADLLNKVGLTYKAAHQFDRAAEYFKKSLDANPKNIAVRDDYASCLYYSGKVDEALDQLQKSLSYDPKHSGTLFNIGMIKWKGKGDVDGAIASWNKLLELNPNFEKKQAIEQLIQQAKASKGQIEGGQKS